MSFPKIGPAASPQVSTPPSSVQGGAPLKGSDPSQLDDIRLSSGDRWLHYPKPKPPPWDSGDSFTPSTGNSQSGKPILL